MRVRRRGCQRIVTSLAGALGRAPGVRLKPEPFHGATEFVCGDAGVSLR